MELTPIAVPSVEIRDGVPVTTSLNVAAVFGKRHDDVLKSIRKLAKEEPEYHARNFAELFHVVRVNNGAQKKCPMFSMTRDGMVFLVMGYTGAEARKFKIAYIEAFNRMEAELSGKHEERTTVTSRKPLDKLVKVWAVRAAIPYQQAWTMLDSHFCLTDIKDLPLSKLQEAIAWVQARIDALPPEQPKALPAPKKDKYELFIEKLENVRQRREKEMTDLMSEALVLTQPLKWGLDHWHPICYATRKWVEQTINSPSKVGAFGDKELPIMFGKLADSVRFAAE
ncbi:MAG: Rha family transcriptional regulator [Mailhella sp.]|nr:Rha family transcriptional regulator [Mailhella sp.]